MTFTCNIKKVDFFIDQDEELGQVTIEHAIEIFHDFPFAEQFKELSVRELSSSLPTITFKSANKKELAIWAKNEEGFYLHYNSGNKISDFYLSNNFEKNTERLIVEDFIALFFNGTIEKSLNLKNRMQLQPEIEEKSESLNDTESLNIVTYSFKGASRNKDLFWLLPWLIVTLLLLKMESKNFSEIRWGIYIMLSFFWMPSIIIHISYWIKNYGSKVTIDTKSKKMTYQKNGQIIEFSRDDIHHCEVNETRSFKVSWYGYRYIWFVLKDKRQVVITNFITEPDNIIDALKPNFKIEKRTIPFLPI